MHAEEMILARNIRAKTAWRGWSQAKLADEAQIGQSTLSRKIQDPGKFTIKELLKLSKALDVDLTDLYKANT